MLVLVIGCFCVCGDRVQRVELKLRTYSLSQLLQADVWMLYLNLVQACQWCRGAHVCARYFVLFSLPKLQYNLHT